MRWAGCSVVVEFGTRVQMLLRSETCSPDEAVGYGYGVLQAEKKNKKELAPGFLSITHGSHIRAA